MITRVLVANRGEIAVRIMRACDEMGIDTVAVYSDADAHAPHVRAARHAVRIGPPPPSESYLSIGKLIDAARATGADAVHPGYGFLAENAGFASACQDAGLVFVGPPAEAIAAMGSKIAARRAMQQAGVPVVPGETPVNQSDAALASCGTRPTWLSRSPEPGMKPVPRSATVRSTSSAWSRTRATSKSRCWQTTTDTWCTCSSATAPCSAAIRK
jgi:acetyl/propionyl-CoA carboxylase alpha subunit